MVHEAFWYVVSESLSESWGSWVADKWNKGKEKVASAVGTVKGKVLGAFDYIKALGKETWDKIKALGEEYVQWVNGVKEKISEIIDDILNPETYISFISTVKENQLIFSQLDEFNILIKK